MKILFIKDVKGTAKRGEAKEIAEGYAMNFLLPQGLAVKATTEAISALKKELDQKVKAKVKVIDHNQVLADKIKGRKIELRAKANEAGKLYGAIGELEVKTELARLGFEVKTAKIIFKKHIKEAGDYSAKVDFGNGISSTINILVRV